MWHFHQLVVFIYQDFLHHQESCNLMILVFFKNFFMKRISVQICDSCEGILCQHRSSVVMWDSIDLKESCKKYNKSNPTQFLFFIFMYMTLFTNFLQ